MKRTLKHARTNTIQSSIKKNKKLKQKKKFKIVILKLRYYRDNSN